MRPVISLDATHLKSVYKGYLYTYSGLMATNKIYIYTFGIAYGNECYETWQFMCEMLKEAIPNLTDGTFMDTQGNTLRPSFVSDRNKGIARALDVVFPGIGANHCAQHIRSNVETKFGKELGKLVIPIAKTVSMHQEENWMTEIRRLSPSCWTYLNEIEAHRWWGTCWAEHPGLYAPRYGIVTSNTSKAVNAMLDDNRGMGWLGLIDRTLGMVGSYQRDFGSYVELYKQEEVQISTKMRKRCCATCKRITMEALERMHPVGCRRIDGGRG